MNLLKSSIRTIAQLRSYSASTNVLEHLPNRKLIRVSGDGVSDFLQGIITNDIHHLDHGMGSLYAMFLNTKGRILYDTIIYKMEQQNLFLLECDVNVLPAVQKHLKLYRVRRKIDIVSVADVFDVYAMFDPDSLNGVDTKRKSLDGAVVPCDTLNLTQPENTTGTRVIGDVLIYKDPRIISLGSRIIAPKNHDVRADLTKITTVTTNTDKNYRWFRYNLGVGEGIVDLPPSDCFPLEANCDYLHGVSFHKGCYIGQELTARTHHTGIVRKRLMPLFFKSKLIQPPVDNKIIHNDVNLGKLRGFQGTVGLGLLRIAQAIQIKDIQVGDGVAKTGKPNWWPLEARKEKMTA